MWLKMDLTPMMLLSAMLLLLPSVTGRPNFLIFYADDLGIGDVGCFGNNTIRTPGMDSICKEGVKLSHHLAAAATCTPSRTALMTGRYPIRSGMASNYDLDAIPSIQSYSGLGSNQKTFPKLLQNSGYYNGLIGKWHLGLHSNYDGNYAHHPTRHGFNYFFGTPLSNSRAQGDNVVEFIWEIFPQMIYTFYAGGIIGVLTGWLIKRKVSPILGILVMTVSFSLAAWRLYMLHNARYLVNGLWRNEQLVEQPINFDRMTQRLVNEGLAFLRDRQKDGKPFLLMMSWLQVHTILHATTPFLGRSNHGRYGDEVEEMDWGVAEVLKGLKRYGFKDNTVVYFSSDNGGHIEEHEDGERAGGHNGIFRGGKVQGGQEGGIRMPSAISWPGKLPAGAEVTEPTLQMDIYPTFLNLAGVEPPTDRVLDGKNILPLLKKEKNISPHKFMMHYCCSRINAVRYRPTSGSDIYKVHYFWPNWDEGTEGCASRFACPCYRDHYELDFPKLYNIAKDPGEKVELDVTQPKYKTILDKMAEAKLKHEESVEEVPCQYNNWYAMYRPWLHYYTFCYNCQDPNNALDFKF